MLNQRLEGAKALMDPLTYGVVVGVLLVSALAAYRPARRAASIQPVRVLKSE